MKDPDLIDDDRLRADVCVCIEEDALYSPLSDKARRLKGLLMACAPEGVGMMSGWLFVALLRLCV